MLDNHDIETFKDLLQDIGSSISTLDIPRPDYRTQAAIAAMQSLLSADNRVIVKLSEQFGTDTAEDTIATASVILADALMAELAK